MQTNSNDWQAAPRLARGYNQVGELLLKVGDATTALDHFRRALAVVEQARSQGSTRHPTLRQLALSYFHIGQTYAAMAASAPTRQRPQHWRDVRHAYQRSLDLFLELCQKGALLPEQADKPEQITRAIARCDATLAK